MKTRLLVLSIAALCISAAPAVADPWKLPGAALQAVFDTRTLGPVVGVSSIDVDMDYIPDSLDSYWTHTAAGSVSSIIVELAAYDTTNTFGIYDSTDHTDFLQVFAGGHAAGASRTVYLGASGEIWLDIMYNPVFPFNLLPPDADFDSTWYGFYLDSTADPSIPPNEGIWYSDTSLNSDNSGAGYDHMFAYQGEGDSFDLPVPLSDGVIGPGYHYLCFEDLDGDVGADWDYTDMVVMVESVMVPVPAAIVLGMLGLGVVGLKLRKYA